MKKTICFLSSLVMVFILSVSVFADETDITLMNNFEKSTSISDVDDGMIHELKSISVNSYGQLVVEEYHYSSEPGISIKAHRDQLLVSFKELRSHNGDSIERYDHKYKTFQWINGYTSKTSYQFIQSYLASGNLYQATVSYTFY